MTNEETIKYLIPPVSTSTIPHNECLKEKEAYELAIKALKERSQGEWYYSCDKGWECNQCHKKVKDMPIDDNKKATYNFCPNCGADMRGNDNGTT